MAKCKEGDLPALVSTLKRRPQSLLDSLQDGAYLRPFLPDDALLFSFEDLDEDEEDEGEGDENERGKGTEGKKEGSATKAGGISSGGAKSAAGTGTPEF